MSAYSSIFLFDIDGTLIGPGAKRSPGISCHGLALIRAAQEVYAVDLDLNAINFIGMTDRQILRALLKKADILPEQIESKMSHCLARSSDIFSKLVSEDEVAILPGVIALIEALTAAGDELGLVTGNVKLIAQRKLQLVGLDSYFSFGGFGCEEHQERYELVIRALKRATTGAHNSQRVFMVGDTLRDIEAGRLGGAITVAVGTGHEEYERLAAAKPDILLRDLSDTGHFLNSISSFVACY